MNELVDSVPPFVVRFSKKQKHLRMRLTRDKGLVVSAPTHVSKAYIESWLVANKQWIDEKAHELGIDLLNPGFQFEALPSTIELRAFGKSISVISQAGVSNGIIGNINSEWVQVTGQASIEDKIERLRRWLMRAIKPFYERWLFQLSQQTGLPYQKLTVRAQKTRWGSYSSQGAVSLNIRVAFLPTALAEYVLLHELAHSKHFDHSPAFWQLLESVCPDARFKDRQLNQAHVYLPDWII